MNKKELRNKTYVNWSPPYSLELTFRYLITAGNSLNINSVKKLQKNPKVGTFFPHLT